MDAEPETYFRNVHILESLQVQGTHYTGLTDDLPKRFAKHNAGEVPHTSKFKPWRIETAIAFSNPAKAAAFELYLNSGHCPHTATEPTR